ncbi:MAG TPA: guanylate kinase [Actinomycetota bacterium]|nr:guanylate kinase [Actinomycetota bacterium]
MTTPGAAARRARGRLFVVSGPSGAGKGTVVRKALARRPGVRLSVSATTRPPRPGERDGVEYHFVGEPEFRRMRDAGELLEWAEVYGNLYGTPRRDVDDALDAGGDVLCELDIQGAEAIRRAAPDAILVFIEPPSVDDLRTRLEDRGTEGPDERARRMAAARSELRSKALFDHVVVNDDADEAAAALVRILEAPRAGKG